MTCKAGSGEGFFFVGDVSWPLVLLSMSLASPGSPLAPPPPPPMSTDIVFYQKLGDEPMSWSPSLGVVFGIFCVGGGDDENGWGLGSWCWREMGLGGVVNCDLMMSESDCSA